MLTFNAEFVSIDRENGISTLGMADKLQGEGDYVIFQWQDEYDEQDARLGQDVPYIEVNSQASAQYNKIDRIVIKGTTIVIEASAGSAIEAMWGKVIIEEIQDIEQVSKVITNIYDKLETEVIVSCED